MLDKHIVDFNESLIGLRDFVELIEPFLNDKVEEHDQHVRPLVLSAMLKEVLTEQTDMEGEERDKLVEMQEKIQSQIDTKYSEETEVLIVKDKTDDNKVKSFSIKIKSNNDKIVDHISNSKIVNKHINLLYTNSLISLLSNVEWFFSQILHYYYDEHPESAGVQKRTLTLKDLKTFSSVDDAEKYLIDVKIDEVLRGNFESWASLLKEEIGLGLGYLKPVMDELIEIYQRRNLFVHNGGVVNSIYISKVKESLRKNIDVGDQLEVDKNYLENSICQLQKAFILIGAELWKKLNPEDEKRGEILGEIVYENLLHSRWDICEGLCYFSINDSQINPVDKVIAQINYWLCKKETDDYKSIEKEINKADYSDKKEIFQLGLFALRGETEKLINILQIVLETNQTNIERLEEFPILREYRETAEYKEFKAQSKFFKEENKDVITPETVEKE
ncbi:MULTISPECIES: hypothetical protein [Bizionia]|uniref:Uncharacterized protein n=1 Tax=Bizionia algoritergicola TaxID=291187 RepID=A0A5D0QWS0_9FLAO|nr:MULTISPECIES: hypothetical protein [Bizionia]OBX22192.1 hypothetical protein BAA08_09620 [Bizionia sp. APA-3]TYB73235.1 hypothetical protein ES675_06110 [Bizionia algoritergicola]